MHIAILGPSHPWRGGIAHHSANLYRALEDAGHRVDLYNFARLYPEIFFPGKTQRDESESPFAVPGPEIFDPIDPRSWWRIGREVSVRRPDVLVLQWWHPFFAPGYAAVGVLARQAGCRVVLMCHNVEPHESTPVDRLLLRLVYAVPDRFVVQSTAERGKLERLGVGGDQIRIARHPRYEIFEEASAPASRAQARRRWGAEAEHLIVFFGLVRPYKGVDLLIEAAARLPDSLDWQLIVAGEIYGLRDELDTQIERLGLSERVRLEDRYLANEEVPGLFRAADICALPYRHATGSGAANAAAACGARLVMSDLPSLREAFDDADAVWCEPEDVDSLRDALVEALEQPRTPPTSSAAGWQDLVDALIASP